MGVRPPLPAPIESMLYQINASSDAFFCAQTVPKVLRVSRFPLALLSGCNKVGIPSALSLREYLCLRCPPQEVFFSFAHSALSPPSWLQPKCSKPVWSALKGVDTVSSVMIGETGAPVGYNAPYPVNTLVYPDGQIIYRVEWAMMRGEVGQMQKSFGSGTAFQISSVDFKDDRLELKLTSRNHDSGRSS